MRTKLEFPGTAGTLSGLLESPDDTENVRFYALFAHCFTCGNDIAAATRISRALTDHGVAVLRFDFTGLGNSDGDFANTNFSSNIQDLLAAVDYLRAEYQAPKLLIGHSLGGAAVLAAAAQVPESEAVATIGAPAEAGHVAHNFKAHLDDIEQTGEAMVQLGTREFKIRKQFLTDLENYDTEHIGKLKKALLVMHAPLDATVPVKEAEKIYHAAKHPKSFISLDDADHLLSNSRDSEYAASIISAWATRYVSVAELPEQQRPGPGQIVVEEMGAGFTQRVRSDSHDWLADEPLAVGGKDLGPDPYEHLLAALGTCTSMTLRLYANHKKLPLEKVRVTLSHDRNHEQDCEDCEKEGHALEAIQRSIAISGELSDEQRTRLLQIADRCPVHKTLTGKLAIITEAEGS